MTQSPYTRIDDGAAPPAPGARPSVVVIGNFDGVHRGHRAVLATARRLAGAARAVFVLTFDPHPGAVLGRGLPPALTTLARKSELLRGVGADIVYARTFDKAFSTWPPERFAEDLVKDALLAEVVVVGEDFRFGAQRAGDFAALRALGQRHGFSAESHEIAADAGGPFTSTRARAALERGDLAEAEAVLGRRHAFSGVVREGDKRGRTIGFPTANVEEIPELVPKNGVYAVVVDVLDGAGAARALGKGVMNVGVRPTVDGAGRRTQEVHLFDLDADLYGKGLRVHLVARLRDERRFAGLAELKAQIGDDSARARAAVAAIAPSGGAFG